MKLLGLLQFLWAVHGPVLGKLAPNIFHLWNIFLTIELLSGKGLVTLPRIMGNINCVFKIIVDVFSL